MKNKELFTEKRNILFAKSQLEGYVAIDVLKELAERFELDQNEFVELVTYFDDKQIEVLLPYEVYLKKIKSKQAKINFCYYILLNLTKTGDVDVSEYDPDIAPKIVNLTKSYINHFLNHDEKRFVNLYFGLDTGKPVQKDDEAVRQLDWSLSYYVQTKESVFNKFKEGDNASTLNKRASNIKRFTKIDDYEVRTVKYGSKEEDSIIFVPMSEGRDVVGPVILMEKNDNHPISLGFLRNPGQMEFDFTIYNDEQNSYAVNFYNKSKKPRPELYATSDQICFGLYYPNLGYHGNQYIFEKGKKVKLIQSWEGDQSTSRYLEFPSPDKIYRGLTYEPFKKGLVTKQEGDGYRRFIVENPGERTGLACQINDDGTMMIGQYMNNQFNGIVMQSDGNCENFRLGIVIDNVFVEDFYISVEKSIQSITYYKKAETKAMALEYSPFFLREEMNVVITNEKDEVEARIKLANPLFKKVDLAKKASPEIKEGELTPEQKLANLIGLETVKKHVARLKALFIKRKNDHVKQSLHMLFTGNPGTGKTEVARLLAGIMYDEGIIPENKFVETDRSGLVGAYIGQSEEKTKKVIESAMGGVLFIDEAYSLFTDEDDSKDFGKVVMDALVKAMEDYRDKLCIIFAGYKAPMEKLLSMNPGFKSRISYVLDFPDYSYEELKLIAQAFVKSNGYTLSEEALTELVDIVELNREDKNFGNAREVRNILENLYAIQAERTIDDLSNRLITIDDINVYEKEQHIIKKKKTEDKKAELSYEDILRCSSKVEDPFIFTQRYVEEASVNIKVLNKPNGDVEGEGSGFFITDKGLIATCAHVIDGAESERLRVIVNIYTDKGKKTTKSYSAAIVGYNKVTDVGLIQLLNIGDDEFIFYPLLANGQKIQLLSNVIMAGYPLGGERFEKISLNEGKAQSYNKDSKLSEGKENVERLYLDLFGVPGNSGSGVIDKATGQCVGIFAGASVERVYNQAYELNYAIPTDYLWNLIERLKKENEQ